MAPHSPAPPAFRTAALTCLVLAACGTQPAPPEPAGDAIWSTPSAMTPEPGLTLALGHDVPFASLEVPAHSRAHAATPPDRIPLAGWTSSQGGYTVPNPIRVRNVYFHKPNPGMQVFRADGTEVPHRYYADKAPVSWKYDADTITVVGLDAAPADGDFVLAYPLATQRERALNQATSGLAADAFVRTTAQAGSQSRTGLLLPAPGAITWSLQVPERAALRFNHALIAPEVADGPASDGATLHVTVDTGAGPDEIWTHAVTSGTFTAARIDLSHLAGQQITLGIRTDPGADPTFDYVFLADPVVGTVKQAPRRAFLVFVDTLRPDHLSAYGYERDTSPALEGLVRTGVRFDNARSIAPWTLPSARTMVTGQHPEQYFDSETLQARLSKAGWATAMFAGNTYLGASFAMNRDWALHQNELLAPADEQLDRALAWLDEQEGRDAFMLLHLMDPHLPYKEPRAYRNLYAGDPPQALARNQNGYHRGMIVGAKLQPGDEQQYVRDRYDNNIRFADDQLARLYARVGPQDVVLFLSDHGEEFWDHGSFEHGHSLYDELLRVPFLLRAPGLKAGSVVTAPVSMLDVTPTLLDLLGQPTDGLAGTSLVAAASGDEGALTDLSERAQAFGRPLYGNERWGVLTEDLKYQVLLARDELYNVAKDPGETTDVLAGNHDTRARMHAAMGRALGKEVTTAYRIGTRYARTQPDADLTATVRVPGGIRAAWVGQDPTANSMALLDWKPGSDTLTVTWPAPYRGGRDVWFVPTDDMAKVTHGITVLTRTQGPEHRFTIDASKPKSFPNTPELLLRERTDGRAWELGFGVTPIPLDDDAALSGYDAETAEMLKAMGYAVGDDEP